MKREVFASRFNFETLARLFFKIAEERYPSTEKVLQLTSQVVDPLSHEPLDNLHIKIAVLSAIRNMVKSVSPTRIYRSYQHRDDLYLAVIETLESLEDEVEALEEQMLAQEEQEGIET